MKTKLLAAIAAAAIGLTACGGGGSDDPVTAVPPTAAPVSVAPAEAAAPPAPASTAPEVLLGSTGLGDVLVGSDGRTLYGFTNDVEASSTCYGTCADAWPPVLVASDWVPGPGLDIGIFATTQREDGSTQLVAGKWPLYYFAGDAVPGDVNGQGSGDVWFAAAPTGGLITEVEVAPAEGAAAPVAGPVQTAATSLGDTLVDAGGRTLYGFLADEDGVPTCEGACADAWPPLVVDGTELPAGLDPQVFTVVARPDGTSQLEAGRWPLYRFAGDAAPGDVNGQGSGDSWFAADPTGGLIKGVGAAATESAPATASASSSGNGY
jgi:predicted lipoprotein with Yx(FWY)xxD motif